jgi:hypothetical protein
MTFKILYEQASDKGTHFIFPPHLDSEASLSIDSHTTTHRFPISTEPIYRISLSSVSISFIPSDIFCRS